MFAPENYLSYFDVSMLIAEWTSRISLASLLDQHSMDNSFVFEAENFQMSHMPFWEMEACIKIVGGELSSDSEIHWNHAGKLLRELHFEGTILYCKALSEFLISAETFICSPQVQVLRAPRELLLHMDRLDYCDWKWPARTNPTYRTFFERFDEGQFDSDDIGKRFCFINPMSGLVEIKNNSIEGYRLASDFGLMPYEANQLVRRLVKPFVGWSLVWQPDGCAQNVFDCLNQLGFFAENWGAEVALKNGANIRTKQKRGRPPSATKAEFYRRYLFHPG